MTYYTKNGSIPTQTPDGTDGWVEVPAPPTDVPDGKELVWLNWEWVVRDPKPADRDGYQWNWAHEPRTWFEYALPSISDTIAVSEPTIESPSEPTSEPDAPAASDPYPFSALTTDQMA